MFNELLLVLLILIIILLFNINRLLTTIINQLRNNQNEIRDISRSLMSVIQDSATSISNDFRRKH